MNEKMASTGSTSQIRVDEPIPLHLGARAGSGPAPDLIDQTKNQIRELVKEISDLAKSDCPLEQFFEGFLGKIASALASVGGAIWTCSSVDQSLRIEYHINFQQANLANDKSAQSQHTQLLARVVQAAEPTLVPPNSGTKVDASGNPTDFLLILCPLIVDQTVVGLVEILQRPGGGPATQRGYLRFLSQMCDLGNEFLKSHRLREYSRQQELWQDLEQFSRTIHQSLDPQVVAYNLVNDARRIVGCDRVAVAVRDGRNFRVMAVSGLDSLERRAEQVKRLGELAQAASRSGQSLWYEGNSQDLAPQVEQPLQAYLDKSHSKMVAVIPLSRPSTTRDDPAKPSGGAKTICGALIFEQVSNSRMLPATKKRCEFVSEHASSALSNALISAPLIRFQRSVGWLVKPFLKANSSKTIALGAIAAGLGLALCLVPYPFELGAKGKLKAVVQQEVYAHVEGTLTRLVEPVDPQGIVEVGDVLATMSNNDLLLQIEKLEGELNKTSAQVRNLQHQSLDRPKGSNRDADRRDRFYLESELAKAQALEHSLLQELEITRQQAELLTIRSPIRGQVVDWQLQRNLLGRPVNRGEKLMTVIAPDTKFQVELYLPEKRVGHLVNALKGSNEPLTVTFTLASQPGLELHGNVVACDESLSVHENDGNSERILVDFDNTQAAVEVLRPGTRITAKVDCGSRSVGYVLFHELFETIQGTLKFWL